MLSSYLLGTKFLCCISLIFVACLEFINICKDQFVCYLWIGELNVQNLLACLLSLIYLAGFTYFNFITLNTALYFTIAICIYSTGIGNQSSIYIAVCSPLWIWNSYTDYGRCLSFFGFPIPDLWPWGCRKLFSSCALPPISKGTELGSVNQEASPSASKNTSVGLVPCWAWKCGPAAIYGVVDISKFPEGHLLQQMCSQWESPKSL